MSAAVEGLRRAARRWLPPPQRVRLAAVMRSTSAALADTLAVLLAAAMKPLPDGVLLAVRERLSLRRRMDYPGRALTLAVTSKAERDLRLRSCRKEPETVEWIESTIEAGDVLYDVGANVGAYALVAASRMRGESLVYAFEPGYRTFSSLVENIVANRLGERVIPFQVALGEATGLATFVYEATDPGAAGHPGLDARPTGGGAGVHQPVLAYRLDEFAERFALRAPTHLKIDVDGGELGVLRGAARLLASPTLRWVLVEVETGRGDPDGVRALLLERGLVLARDVAHPGGAVHNWIFRRVQPIAAPGRAEGEAGGREA